MYDLYRKELFVMAVETDVPRLGDEQFRGIRRVGIVAGRTHT